MISFRCTNKSKEKTRNDWGETFLRSSNFHVFFKLPIEPCLDPQPQQLRGRQPLRVRTRRGVLRRRRLRPAPAECCRHHTPLGRCGTVCGNDGCGSDCGTTSQSDHTRAGFQNHSLRSNLDSSCPSSRPTVPAITPSPGVTGWWCDRPWRPRALINTNCPTPQVTQVGGLSRIPLNRRVGDTTPPGVFVNKNEGDFFRRGKIISA